MGLNDMTARKSLIRVSTQWMLASVSILRSHLSSLRVKHYARSQTWVLWQNPERESISKRKITSNNSPLFYTVWLLCIPFHFSLTAMQSGVGIMIPILRIWKLRPGGWEAHPVVTRLPSGRTRVIPRPVGPPNTCTWKFPLAPSPLAWFSFSL